MDKSTRKEHPPPFYALLLILEGVIVYYHTYFLDWDKSTSRKTAYVFFYTN
jgi:hypothetical protein